RPDVRELRAGHPVAVPGHRGAAGPALPPAGEPHRLLRRHRAGGRQRPCRYPHPRRREGRLVPHQRREVLHYQRRRGQLLRPGGDRRAGLGLVGAAAVHGRRAGVPRGRRDPGGAEDGPAGLLAGRPLVRERRGAGREHDRRRDRPAGGPAAARLRPAQRGRDGLRARPGGDGLRPGLHAGAPGLREAGLRVSGRVVPHRRHGHPHRGRPGAGRGRALTAGVRGGGLTGMRFGVALPQYGPATAEGLTTAARQAEDLGFDDVWVADHIAVPVGAPYPPSFLLEALATLSFAAAVTTRIGLGTSVLVLPLRQPVVAAKQVATLDVLSGGRLTLGLGAGWLREEFEACNVEYRKRGDLMDEAIAVLRACWASAPTSFTGPTVSFTDMKVQPLPGRHIPMWIGGVSERALRRAVEHGDGWTGAF